MNFKALEGFPERGDRLENVLSLIQEHQRVINLEVRADLSVEPMI
ncbi:hypothetical protein SAMN04488025_109110 [Planifilum fulgidum]|jgi:hypothetical protein|uniref:Uncharacterized protein n=1 Tax=Planifilum fulgidum TaxID=201973 RepID=A0A1I2MU28_9BACL|nr:hypothetical protein SAMN04488025_109110 [Planifilum fulgidum]